jgi:hypothetical protein
MCFIVNGTSSVREFLSTTFLKQYLMQTSPKQISMFTEEEFQSCQAASLANPTQVLESDLEKRMNATCGPKCLEQFEKFNHVGSWAKMFSALLIGMEGWYSKRCRLTWKLKGTKSNRLYFQLQASTLPTEEIESGLLPTPTSVMTDEPPEKMRERAERNGYKNGTQYGSLLSQVKYGEILPTPTTGADQKTQYQQGGRSLMNYMDFHGMLPTPNSRDYKDNVGNGRDAPSIGKTRGYSLGQKINSMSGMLPTPTTSCANAGTDKERPTNQPTRRSELNHLMSQEAGKSSQLNPPFVAEMMGFPTDWTILPFLSGETNPSKHTGTQ